MADTMRFDGRVVLVTGAGGGLGKQYALAFAARGASVVANDLGGDPKGEGKSSRAADLVVDEIRALGGKAVADYHSVEDGDKVVQTALDAFGRIDIVVNNAGILRDRTFARISDLDWDLLQRVHLRGSFLVTRAAWPHMKKQKFGRVIMTTSTSGLFGNFGQANYSAAKMGLVGLCNTLALEGAKYNILCNTIAPLAGSRLTQGIFPPDMIEQMKPDHVVPMVLYLCHDSFEGNGSIFQSAGGWHGQIRWERTKGVLLHKHGIEVTPEMIRDNWDGITDWSKADHPTSETVLTPFLNAKDIESSSQGEQEIQSSDFTYTHRDVILYALGVGVSAQADYSHLKFLYEGHEDFCVLPTFGVITSMQGLSGTMASGQLGGLNFDPTRLLHGEQYIELFKPIPTSGTVSMKGEVADILDKGKGAVVLINVTTYDDKGEPICLNQASIYLGGAGGFGGKRSSDKNKPLSKPPTRKPDATILEKTGLTQAALYRLNGDSNPLHIDPAFAQMGGFSTPILHGLCSFGIACRHVLHQYAGDDVNKFKAMKTRFAKPVIPGQTLQTDMWREGSRIHIQCKVVETGSIVLTGGYVDLKDVSQNVSGVAKPMSSGLKSVALFEELKQRIASRPELVKKINGIFQWNVTKDGKTAGQWVIDLKRGNGAVIEGTTPSVKPDCTITLTDEDLIGIATGKLNPQELFMKGRMKVTGNVMLTVKLNTLFKEQSKM